MEKPLSIMRLFVYGTLRKGFDHPLARKLAAQGSYLGQGRVRGTLFDLGAYPGLTLDHSDQRVIGDVFLLPPGAALLGELDMYEGCHESQPQPHEYHRISLEVQLTEGRKETAFTYILNGSTEDLKGIESGDYLAYLASQRKV